METNNLLPALSGQSLLERRYSARILAYNPGLGDAAAKAAADLVDAGLGPTASTMLIAAIYSPTDEIGRGQSTRAKWFVQTVRQRYGSKLPELRSNVASFRSFLADMEEVMDLRDTLKGEGVSLSFHNAFLLWELGQNAETVMSLLWDLPFKPAGKAVNFLLRAAAAVKSKHFMELETAIESMLYGREPYYD